MITRDDRQARRVENGTRKRASYRAPALTSSESFERLALSCNGEAAPGPGAPGPDIIYRNKAEQSGCNATNVSS